MNSKFRKINTQKFLQESDTLVNNISNNNITYITGKEGTGKTNFIIKIINKIVNDNKILFLSLNEPKTILNKRNNESYKKNIDHNNLYIEEDSLSTKSVENLVQIHKVSYVIIDTIEEFLNSNNNTEVINLIKKLKEDNIKVVIVSTTEPKNLFGETEENYDMEFLITNN